MAASHPPRRAAPAHRVEGAVDPVVRPRRENFACGEPRIASLGRGHHIECKDLEELLETEDTVRTACKNVTRFLEVAETFNGSETVIEYEKGEEKIHVTQAAPPLLAYASPETPPSESNGPAQTYQPPSGDFEQRVRELWSNPQFRKIVYFGGGLIVLILLLRSCS